jgi:hypothetical protein
LRPYSGDGRGGNNRRITQRYLVGNGASPMTRIILVLGLSLGLASLPALSSSPAHAQKAVKAGKGEKVCRVKLQYSGQVRTWVCKSNEPCCVWHEINYVKCGSPITGCL